MEAYLERSSQLKKKKKMQKKEEPDRSGLEIDICMEKFFFFFKFLLLPLLKVKVCDCNDTPPGLLTVDLVPWVILLGSLGRGVF